jgi:hypothetical protein
MSASAHYANLFAGVVDRFEELPACKAARLPRLLDLYADPKLRDDQSSVLHWGLPAPTGGGAGRGNGGGAGRGNGGGAGRGDGRGNGIGNGGGVGRIRIDVNPRHVRTVAQYEDEMAHKLARCFLFMCSESGAAMGDATDPVHMLTCELLVVWHLVAKLRLVDRVEAYWDDARFQRASNGFLARLGCGYDCTYSRRERQPRNDSRLVGMGVGLGAVWVADALRLGDAQVRTLVALGDACHRLGLFASRRGHGVESVRVVLGTILNFGRFSSL